MAAMNFAEGGVILAFGRYDAEVPCFDMQLFSCFEHEKEVLFFGGDSILKICNIMKYERNSWKAFAREINALEAVRSLINGSPLPSNTSWKTKEMMLNMMQSVLQNDFEDDSVSPYIQSLLHHQLYSAPNQINLDWSILLADYGFFTSILMKTPHSKDDGHQNVLLPDIVNLSGLLPMSQHITLVMPSTFYLNSQSLCSIINDIEEVARRRPITLELHCGESIKRMKREKLMKLSKNRKVTVSQSRTSIIFDAKVRPSGTMPVVRAHDVQKAAKESITLRVPVSDDAVVIESPFSGFDLEMYISQYTVQSTDTMISVYDVLLMGISFMVFAANIMILVYPINDTNFWAYFGILVTLLLSYAVLYCVKYPLIFRELAILIVICPSFPI